MEKSLLSILEREQKLVLGREACDDMIRHIRRQTNVIYGYEIDCEARNRDLRRMSERMDDEIAKRAKIEEELEIIRNEMREYFQELIKSGA